MVQSDRSDVFISYRRKDVDFAKQMDQALKDTGREVWVDWEDIPPGVEGFADEIQRGIDGADAMVAILSPNYLESEYCLMELDYAIRHNKRVVPIIYDKFDGNPPSGIGHINWVYFVPHAGQENTFEESFPKVIAALEQDLDHIRNHTRLLLRAQEWDERKRVEAFLMDGEEVEEGEEWILKGEDLNPEPLPIHREFISASRKNETAKIRRARMMLSVGLVISVMLLVVAIALGFVAEQNRQEAELARAQAVEAELEAEAQRELAIQQSLLSEEVALMSNSQLTLYRDSDSDLAIALALKALDVNVAELEPEAYRVLSEAAYHPGTRRLIIGHDDDISSMDVNDDGTLIYSADHSGMIRVTEVQTGNVINVIEDAHNGIVWDIELSSDETFFVTGATDGFARVWDAQSGDLLHEFSYYTDLEDDEDPRGILRLVAVTPDNESILISFDKDPTILMISLADGDIIHEFIQDDRESETVEGHSNVVRDLEFMDNRPTFVSGDADGNLLVWNWRTGDLVRKMALDDAIYSIALEESGQRAFTSHSSQDVNYWNLVSGQQIGSPFEGHSAAIYQIALSPDETQLLTASQDLSIRLWDVATRKTLNTFVGHGHYVYQVEFLPDGEQFVTASWDGTMRLWDKTTQEFVDNYTGHENTIYQLTYDDTGERILSASGDATARIWDAETGDILQTFGVVSNEDPEAGHENLVIGSAWSPDNTQVVTTGNDNTVRIWDVETGDLLHTFPPDNEETEDIVEGHSATAWTVVWLNDTQVLSAGFDRRIILWDIETQQQVRIYERVHFKLVQNHVEW